MVGRDVRHAGTALTSAAATTTMPVQMGRAAPDTMISIVGPSAAVPTMRAAIAVSGTEMVARIAALCSAMNTPSAMTLR